MQSEFACHAGLRAKFFCRVCWVKGKDADDLRDSSGIKHRKEPFDVLKARIRRFMLVRNLIYIFSL